MLSNFLRKFKHQFVTLFNNHDRRAKIQDAEFIQGLLYAIASDDASFSLASLRRRMCTFLGINIGRSAFNERIGTKSLAQQLLQVIALMLQELQRLHFEQSEKPKQAKIITKKLGVSDIVAVDGSMVTLWDGLKDAFPGTFMSASIKLHFCTNLLTGLVDWFELTAGSTHDSQCFPVLKAKTLYIIDLGYWSYSLMNQMTAAKSFFLTRVKSNTKLRIEKVLSGLAQSATGCELFRHQICGKQEKVIEVVCRMDENGINQKVRVVGFWDRNSKSYRWYATNLSCRRRVIATLYRLRWQIELAFKAMKSTLHFDRMPTLQSNGATSFALLAIANYLMSVVIRQESMKTHRKKSAPPSLQRCASVYAAISGSILKHLSLRRNLTRKSLRECSEIVQMLIYDTIDPNWKNRESTQCQVYQEL